MSIHTIDYEDDFPGDNNLCSSDAGSAEDDLWFLPGPSEDEPDFLLPSPRSEPPEDAIPAEWARAEAGCAARLAKVAARLGGLDERLKRGPEGWRHRLALIEAADLSWFAGDRVPEKRLALWTALRISSMQDEGRALWRAGWAVQRLTGGPGPSKGLPDFLGRRDPHAEGATADSLTDRTDGWLALMEAGRELHPITRACMGFHTWALAGLGAYGDQMEAAVTAAWIAASDGSGAVFAPLAMGGAEALRPGGEPAVRLERWLNGMEKGILAAMRQLDRIEEWKARAEDAMSGLSGRTSAKLRTVVADWPIVSAPMAEALTGASRAAVQRNLAWMEEHGLVHEITGQGRFRFWRAKC